ncbi:MAG: hypothetical protein KH230_16945 [Enterocloster asparagiformis]|nr:hypothetical protein [Enterocloster asparagiformis]
MGFEVFNNYECDGQMELTEPPIHKSELQSYLKSFRRDGEVTVIVLDSRSRSRYPVRRTMCVTDMGDPVIIIDVGNPENLDTENLDHTDLSDQMQLNLLE